MLSIKNARLCFKLCFGGVRMEKYYCLPLTDMDRIVLESYKNFAEGLSEYLGDGYENRGTQP